MSDDRQRNGDDELSRARRYATVGSRQVEKRRALGNIPSWDVISELNRELPRADVTKEDISRAAKRVTLDLSFPNDKLVGPTTGT